MPHVVALVPTVPEREENFLALVESLRDQTLRPARIVAFLNGYYRIPKSLPDCVETRQSVVRGPGVRWVFADSELDNDTIIVSLDDDFTIAPTYVEQSVDALMDSDAALVSWSGHITPKKYRDIVPCDEASDLWSAGTGTATVWRHHLRGISEHPLANECFGWGGDEEALVSLWLWQHQLRMVRPAGEPGLHHVHDLQYAPTASHLVHGPAWAARRAAIIEEYGWS